MVIKIRAPFKYCSIKSVLSIYGYLFIFYHNFERVEISSSPCLAGKLICYMEISVLTLRKYFHIIKPIV